MLNSHCVTLWQRLLFYLCQRGVNWDRERPGGLSVATQDVIWGPSVRTPAPRLCCTLGARSALPLARSLEQGVLASCLEFWPLYCGSRLANKSWVSWPPASVLRQQTAARVPRGNGESMRMLICQLPVTWCSLKSAEGSAGSWSAAQLPP